VRPATILPRGDHSTRTEAEETTRMGFENKNSRGPLTAAEKKVLKLVSESQTNKEIAQTLGVSPSTIKRHLENIRLKLHLRNRVEAAIYGLRLRGCPLGLTRGCPLHSRQTDGDDSRVKWAVWPIDGKFEP
jgi:DNA-binding CsgD family transcriptional regulator